MRASAVLLTTATADSLDAGLSRGPGAVVGKPGTPPAAARTRATAEHSPIALLPSPSPRRRQRSQACNASRPFGNGSTRPLIHHHGSSNAGARADADKGRPDGRRDARKAGPRPAQPRRELYHRRPRRLRGRDHFQHPRDDEDAAAAAGRARARRRQRHACLQQCLGRVPQDVAQRGHPRPPARARARLRLPGPAERLTTRILRAGAARAEPRDRAETRRGRLRDGHHGGRGDGLHWRRARLAPLPRQGPHPGLLARAARRRAALLQVVARRAADYCSHRRRPRPLARRLGQHPAHGHGLVGPAAVVQLRQEPARPQRHHERQQLLDVPRRELHLGRLCVCNDAAGRHGPHAHVQPKHDQRPRHGPRPRRALHQPDRLPVEDVQGRGHCRVVQGHDGPLPPHRPAHGRHARRQRAHPERVQEGVGPRLSDARRTQARAREGGLAASRFLVLDDEHLGAETLCIQPHFVTAARRRRALAAWTGPSGRPRSVRAVRAPAVGRRGYGYAGALAAMRSAGAVPRAGPYTVGLQVPPSGGRAADRRLGRPAPYARRGASRPCRPQDDAKAEYLELGHAGLARRNALRVVVARLVAVGVGRRDGVARREAAKRAAAGARGRANAAEAADGAERAGAESAAVAKPAADGAERARAGPRAGADAAAGLRRQPVVLRVADRAHARGVAAEARSGRGRLGLRDDRGGVAGVFFAVGVGRREREAADGLRDDRLRVRGHVRRRVVRAVVGRVKPARRRRGHAAVGCSVSGAHGLPCTRRRGPTLVEVLWRGRLEPPERVERARERLFRLAELDHARLQVAQRALDKARALLVVREEVVPERVLPVSPTCGPPLKTHLAQDLRVAENDDAVLCACERDVEPARVGEEADALVLVAADAAEDDVVLFAALERVDARDLDVLVEVLFERAVHLHVGDDVAALALVRRDDANLGRQHARLEELGDHLFDVGGLGAVEKRRARRRDLLGAEVLVEEHGRVADGPGEVDVFAQALGRGDAVLERALVEHVGREL